MSSNLFQAVTTEANFFAAWERVRGNFGAPGLDRVSIEDFEKNLHDNLALLRTMVAESAYQPLPYLTFTHKKDSGKDRTLRIPTVRDRVAQQALLQVIQPLFEKIFLNCSYAYRPGKSSLQAIERVERNLKRGRVWIVDADIENFFDEIDRQLLLKFLGQTITEPPVLKLIELCINAGSSGEKREAVKIVEREAKSEERSKPDALRSTLIEQPATNNESKRSEDPDSAGQPATSRNAAEIPLQRDKGLAQGMVLAPLLSNIYLHKMDDRMFRAQWVYLRYSDNLLVLCHSEEQAKDAFARAESCLGEVRLKFNQAKTSIRHLREGFTFLGFHFDERGKRPDEPAVHRLHQRVGNVLQKAAEYSEAQLREKIDSIVRGWLNYFRLDAADRKQLLEQLEQKFADANNSMPQRILQAALAYQLGDRDRARKTLRTTPAVASEDAEINYQWGMLCDLLDLKSEALDSYLAAYRLNPDHPESAYRLGLYYLQDHQDEQAIRYLQKAVQLQPQSAAAHFALGTALQNMGLHGVARKSLQRATQLDPRLRKLIGSEPAIKPAPADVNPPLQFTDDDLACFLRLFSGREGVFARQWVNDSGRLGYNAVYQPLTPAEVKAHLSGQQTLGYYLMRSDNTVTQMVIDIDLTRQARVELSSNGSLVEWRNLLWREAVRLMQSFQDLQLKIYPEDSGFKGIHLWLFFSAPLPARDALLLAKRILAQAGPAPPGLHREIFPKEGRVASEALGSMLKLPLGIHKLTNRRCLFLDNDGQPFADQFALLRNLVSISTNEFLAALEKTKTLPGTKPPAEPEADHTEVDKVFQGCNVLRHFRDKAEKTKWLNHVERLTLAGVLGHLGRAGHQAVHRVIRYTTNYNFRITQKWLDRGKGFPVSCPRIRERHSDITPVVGCCCQFPQLQGTYPSPVLHADPEFIVKIKARTSEEGMGRVGEGEKGVMRRAGDGEKGGGREVKNGARRAKGEEPKTKNEELNAMPSAPRPLPSAPSPPPNDLFQSYLKLRKEQREANQKVGALEQQLQALCEQQQIDQFVTEAGTFKRLKVGGEWRWVMEL